MSTQSTSTWSTHGQSEREQEQQQRGGAAAAAGEARVGEQRVNFEQVGRAGAHNYGFFPTVYLQFLPGIDKVP